MQNNRIALQASLLMLCLASASPLPVAGLLDTVSVFSFSQSGTGDPLDTQILHVDAQMNIRTVSTWDNWGAKASDFNTQVFTDPAAQGVIAGGGLTASVVFRDEAPSDSAFLDWITRDDAGDTVSYDNISAGARRGNIASPGFRAHILAHAKAEVDAGAPALFFDEINAGFAGSKYNGNEGFDDYHLKAFNHWLVAKYPAYSKSDFISYYQMDAANALDPSGDLDNLSSNFNYRTYLSTHGWASAPRTASNPLLVEWGRSTDNRMKLVSMNFTEASTMQWWKELVDSIRTYTRNTYGREVYITSNGIEPFVDFNSIGLYEGNADNNGVQANYVPVNGTDLNGSVSLQAVYRSLRKESDSVSNHVPVALFIDWPTQFMNHYYAFTATRKMDYWRIFGAEAYANGLFPAFHLRTTMPGDPTATSMGILDSLQQLVAYYRSHQGLFQGLVWDSLTAQVNITNVSVSTAQQGSTGRTEIFLVNHNDNHGIKAQQGLTVTIPMSQSPAGVTLYAPDQTAGNPTFTYANGTVTIQVNQLLYSATLVIDSNPALVQVRSSLNPHTTSPAGAWILWKDGLAPAWSSQGRDLKGRKVGNF